MYAMRDNSYIKSLLKDISFLQGFKSWVKKEEPEYSEAGHKALDERLVLLKRELRNEYRRRKYESERKRVYESDDGESTTTFFEDYFDSKEEAKNGPRKSGELGKSMLIILPRESGSLAIFGLLTSREIGGK